MSDENLSRDEVEELLQSKDTESADQPQKSSDPQNSNEIDLEAQADAILSGNRGKGQAVQPSDDESGDEYEGTATDLESKADAMLAGAGGKVFSPRQRVLAYDFKRPERVGKEQMRALQSLHEGFARNFGASLSAMLRTIAESKLISVDQLTYSEFVYSLEIPTCFNLLNPNPLEGNWILDISPSILYPIIDRMLGGTPGTESQLKRPLSEIELRLTSRITNTFLRELQSAWSHTIDLECELERVESNPQLVQIVPPNEVVILVSFELMMGKSRGMINLCIPFNTIERIGSKLTNNNWIGYASSKSNIQSQHSISRRISTANVELQVTLAKSTIRAVDLFNLQVGDVITTDKDAKAPLDVYVSGAGKFHGKPGAFKGHKAIEILGPIATNE
jgi:flagellar motor switch protein FliM